MARTIRPDLRALSDTRKRLSVEQGLAPVALPAEASAPLAPAAAAAAPVIVPQPLDANYIEPGTPAYSDAYTKARDQFENAADPATTKIGPNLRRNNATGADIRFPGPGEWQPDPSGLWNVPKAGAPPVSDQQMAAAHDEARAKLEALQGNQPHAWQWQANIAARVTGGSDAPPTTDANGGYDDWLFNRHVAISNDQALDGLMRPQFDQIAAGNPIAAANGDKIGDVWRTVQALTPAATSAPQPQAQPASGQPKPKPKGGQDQTIGLPWGKQYPDVGTMLGDWASGAAGVANDLLGIKPAKGADAQASPAPMTPEQALQYLTGGKNVPPPASMGPLDAAAKVAGDVVRTVGANAVDTVAQVIPGVYGAVKAGLDGIDAITSGVAGAVGDATGVQFLKDYAKGSLGIPEADAVFGPPGTPMGVASRSVAQFMTGFAIGGKVLEGLGWASGGNVVNTGAQFLAKGAVADAGFFNGQTGKLSDLLVQVPGLKNPVTEFLSTNPNDSEAEGRFKNALNGLLAAPLIPAFVGVVRGVRAGGQWAGWLKTAGADVTGAAVPGAAKPTVPKTLLGDASPDAPLTAAVNPATGKIATAAGEVAASDYTPIGGGPAGGPQVFANFAAIKTGDDIQKIANEMAAAYEGTTDAARQGVVTNAATKAAAGELDAFDTLMSRRTGEAPNAAQAYAWKSLYEGSLTKLQEVAQKASQAPLADAPAALLQMREMQSVVLAIQKEFYGARAESGRALQAFKITGDQALQARQVEAMLNQYGGIDANVDLARKIAAIGDPSQLADFIEKSAFTKTKEAWQQLFYFNVLSSPKTHIRNFVGNNVMLGLNLAETGFAQGLSRLMGDEAVKVGEVTAQWYGIKAAFGDAMQAAARTWRTGESTGGYGLNKVDSPARPNAISADAWGLSQGSMFGKAVDVLGAVTAVPGRALQTSDEFFKTVGASATGYQYAFKQAQNELANGTLKPDQVADRITQLVSDFPNTLDTPARAAVADKAAYLTFTTPPKPGGITDTLLKLRSIGDQEDASLAAKAGGMVARTILPFINTPSNILLATFERTPLASITGRYKAAMAAGGAEAYQANARMALGTMMMSTYIDLAMNGTVTGGGPKNPAQRALLVALHWEPYAIKVGDHYISYQGIEPLSTILGWGADIGEMLANTDQKDPTAQANLETNIAAAVFALSDLVLTKSYMQSSSDFINAVNGGSGTGAADFVKKWGAGLIVPNAVRDARNIVDPVQRYTTNIIDEARNRTTGLSFDLPPRRDPFGFIKDYQSGFGSVYDAISPFYATQVKNLPIASAMLKDGWALGMPPMNFTIDGQRIDVTNQPVIYSRFLELRGQVKPSDLTAKVQPNYLASDRYASGEAAQTWADRLTDRYGNRNMTDTLNGIVSEAPPFDLRDLADRYHSFTNADDRQRFILDIKNNYQDAAKAVLFTEYPELPARAAQAKAAGQEATAP